MACFRYDPPAAGGAFDDRAVLLQPAQTLKTPYGRKLLAVWQIPLRTFIEAPFRGEMGFA